MTTAESASQTLSNGKLEAIAAPFDGNEVSSIMFISVFMLLKRLTVFIYTLLQNQHSIESIIVVQCIQLGREVYGIY